MDARMTVADEETAQQEFRPARRRNLGMAILVGAIQDYRSMDKDLHESAARFLFPEGEAWRSHYAWVVGIAENVNAEWLRCQLDRSRGKWDAQRLARKQFRKTMPGRW